MNRFFLLLALLAATTAQGATSLNKSGGPQGPQGIQGPQGSQGPAGSQGPQGIQGPAGTNGTSGTNGTNGTNGSTWYSGSGAPLSGTGVDGDFYFRTDTGDVYKKVSGLWGNSIESLMGPAGPQGLQGIQGPAGSVSSLTSSHVLVGNALNVPTDVAVSGDLTMANTGAATVATVGGSTAANIHSSELAANSATNLNTTSAIVKRDASGNFSAGTVTAALTGTASGNVAKTGDTMSAGLNIGGSVFAPAPALLIKSLTANNSGALMIEEMGTTKRWVLSADGIPSGQFAIAYQPGAANNLTFDYRGYNYFGTTAGKVWPLSLGFSDTATNPAIGITNTNNTQSSLMIANSNSTLNNYSSLVFGGSSNGTGPWDSGLIGVHEAHTAGAETGHLEFWSSNAGTKSKVGTIAKDGRWSLGLPTTVSPTATLHVKPVGTGWTDGFNLENNANANMWQISPDAAGAGVLGIRYSTQTSTSLALANNTLSGFGPSSSGTWKLQVRETDTGTDPTLMQSGQIRPVLAISNGTSTANNFSSLVFQGNSNGTKPFDSGIFGVHEDHTSGLESGHLELWTKNAGTLNKGLQINKDKSVQMPGYSTGVTHFDASGNLSSGPVVGSEIAFGANSLDAAAIATPASPAASTSRVYAKDTAGRTLLRQLSQYGANTAFQPALFRKRITYLTTGSSASPTVIGGQAAVGATMTHTVDETFGAAMNLATTAVANNSSSTGIVTTQFFRGSQSGANGFFFTGRFGFPDASYGTGATGFRMAVGMTDRTWPTFLDSDAPTGARATFAYSTAIDGLNIMFTTASSGAETRTDTGCPFVVNHVYFVAIYCPPYPNNGAISWQIDDETAGTSYSGSSTTNLPVGSVSMRLAAGLETLTTTARNMKVQKLYCESDT